MPRRYRPPKRPVQPDARYNNVNVAKMVSQIMRGGKKSTAQRIMYDSLDLIAERTGRNPVEVFEQAINNVTPTLEVKPRRVGGSTYQVPVEVPPHRRLSLAFRWILTAARARHGRNMADRLAAELMEAAEGQGAAVKKKDDTHRMAEANRAFAHYRW
jgi:small subunit ribosomal protein S7